MGGVIFHVITVWVPELTVTIVVIAALEDSEEGGHAIICLWCPTIPSF